VTYQGEAGRDVSRYMRVAFRELDDGHMIGRAPAAAHLRDERGAVRAGALLTMLDQVAGIGAGLASLPDGWVVSTNLAGRTFPHVPHGDLNVDAHVLRRGRNNVVSAVHVTDDAGTLLADGVLTSAILVPENGPPVWERPVVLEPLGDDDDARPELPPIEEWLGLRVVDATTVEMDLRDDLRNPWGILHGGVVATLVDSAASHATGGDTTTDVVLHFLAPNRVGPVRASVRVLGERADGRVCRVEVRDEGADRVTAVAIATARE
jgi:uncharacterized protein (TIGR00369 family)